MPSYPLRKLIGWFALAVAALLAVTLPLTYTVDRLRYEHRLLSFKAELNAGRVERFIYTHAELWQYQGNRIGQIIALPENQRISQQVIDNRRRVVAEEGAPVDWPRLDLRVPIVVAGIREGELVAVISMTPVLLDIGGVCIGSLLLACLTWLAIRALPLHALDKMLEQLGVQYVRFEAALDNMSQGLCMLNAAGRIAVLNRRFVAMFGIPDRAKLIDASPQRLVEATVHSGLLTTSLAETLFLFRQPVREADNSFTRDLPDGRSITVTRQKVENGGWVATFEDITERRRFEAQLDHMALHDALTSLPNRVLFRAHLERALAGTQHGETLAVLCLDLDRFKGVNDTLGHPMGDALLQSVARRLQNNLRDTDVIARLGGDEFAIIQLGVEQPNQATALAQRLVDVVSEPYEFDEQQMVVGLSIGIAFAPADGASADEVLKNADLALYRAKSDGRGTFRCFEPAMDAQIQARRELELDLRTALANGGLNVHYQPLINLHSGRVCSFETLLRWRHPERGDIGPAEFVPLAEEIGFINPIGEWVLGIACQEATRWPDQIKLAVNLSVAQFRSPHLVQTITAALAAAGLPPRRLEIEITESVLMDDSVSTLATLRRLRDLGISIAMDDFGTGYSSLSYLRSFPFDKLKIDQCFVRDLGTKSESLAIVRAVANLGRALGMAVTAEGVETEYQLEQIKAEGCLEGQGFLFSQPCPAEQIPALLERLHAPRVPLVAAAAD